jgi:hypothetical protein
MRDTDLDRRLADDRAALAALAGDVSAIGLLLRRGDVAAGRLRLQDLVGGMERIPMAARSAAHAVSRYAGPQSPAARALGALMADFDALVPDLLSAQERRDWVMLADLLEYELVPELARWEGLHATLAPGGTP